MSKETKQRRKRREGIAAAVCLLLLVGSMVVTGGPPAAAQGDLAVLEGTMDVGELVSFEWAGEAEIEGGTLTSSDWDAVGGWFPDVNVTADVDTIVTGTHLVLSSYAITVVGTGCVITIHGPLLIDHTTGITYYAHFDAIDLGTVLYSMGCGSGPSSIRNLFETAFMADGLLLQFEVDHVEPEPLWITNGSIDVGSVLWEWAEAEIELGDTHIGPTLWLGNGFDFVLMEVLAHVDSFNPGVELQLLLIKLSFPGEFDCVVVWHGPLTIDHSSGSSYQGFFEKGDLGISYEDCEGFVAAYWLSTLAAEGVVITLEIEHL